MARASYGWPSCVTKFTARLVPMILPDLTGGIARAGISGITDSKINPMREFAEAVTARNLRATTRDGCCVSLVLRRETGTDNAMANLRPFVHRRAARLQMHY